MKSKKIDTFMDLSVTNLSHNLAVREMQQNSKDFKNKIAIREGFKKKYLWKIPYRVLTPPRLWKKFFYFFF